MLRRFRVVHLCGCEKWYTHEAPTHVLQRMVAELERQPCEDGQCPGRAARRLLAAGASPATSANGRGEH